MPILPAFKRQTVALLLGGTFVLGACSEQPASTGLQPTSATRATGGNLPTATCLAITAVQGVAITPVTMTASGGAGAPYTFAATGLPSGVSMSSGGTISGTPSVSGTFAYTVTITDALANPGTVNCSVTVGTATPFATYTQGGWGAKPHGGNPGALLLHNFSLVYPSGSVSIGGTFALTFTSASAITAFLPQGSTPSVLTASKTNPTTSAAGVFAGQVLALTLSVDFSAAGVTMPGLGAQHLLSGALAGQTVSQVLALANAVLGGNTAALPAGLTVSGLNDIVDAINNNYDGGTTDHGYLGP